MPRLYTVIHTGEDGASIEVLDGETLLGRLAEQYWGSDIEPSALTQKDGSLDLTADRLLLIIPGVPVLPRPKEIVTEWELPA